MFCIFKTLPWGRVSPQAILGRERRTEMLNFRHFNRCFNEFSTAMNRQFNKIMTHKNLFILLANLLALVLCSERALAQGSPSVITYQGSLRSAGSPATGRFDFVFTLFDALAGGTQIARPVTKLNVPATDGM